MEFDYTEAIAALSPAFKHECEDVELIFVTYKGDTYNVRRCKVCGYQGGKSLNCEHYLRCKHSIFFEGVEPKKSALKYELLKPSISNLSQESVFCVYMREYATSADHGRLLGSFGATSCYILALRDRISGFTVISHIDSLTIDPVSTMLSCFEDQSRIDVYIVSECSFLGDKSIVRILSRLSSFRMVYCDLESSYVAGGKSLVIDAETGDYYRGVHNYVFKIDEHHTFTASPETFGLSLMFRTELKKAK